MTKAKPAKAGIFQTELKVVNIGIPTFADDLESQGVTVAKVDWKPPAGGDQEMAGILERLGV